MGPRRLRRRRRGRRAGRRRGRGRNWARANDRRDADQLAGVDEPGTARAKSGSVLVNERPPVRRNLVGRKVAWLSPACTGDPVSCDLPEVLAGANLPLRGRRQLDE